MANSIENQEKDANYIAKGERIELTLPLALAGIRLDRVLAELLPAYSRRRLQQWLRDGNVLINGIVATPKHKIWGGEKLQVEMAPAVTASFTAEDIPLEIVFEDETILVLNKPAGLVVHPGNGNPGGTLLNALLQHAPALTELPRAGIVHRLDKDTSGLLVVAKSLIAQIDLVRQLQARTVQREYLALVHGHVQASGKIAEPIGRHPVQRIKMAVTAKGKPAVTYYQPIEKFAACTLVRCKLETGRTHQIRVHMQSIGHPLIGDPVYGAKTKVSNDKLRDMLTSFKRQALHAETLGLVHPQTRAAMRWQAALPDDMSSLLQQLRENNG